MSGSDLFTLENLVTMKRWQDEIVNCFNIYEPFVQPIQHLWSGTQMWNLGCRASRNL